MTLHAKWNKMEQIKESFNYCNYIKRYCRISCTYTYVVIMSKLSGSCNIMEEESDNIIRDTSQQVYDMDYFKTITTNCLRGISILALHCHYLYII